jgi:hypothetical protein
MLIPTFLRKQIIARVSGDLIHLPTIYKAIRNQRTGRRFDRRTTIIQPVKILLQRFSLTARGADDMRRITIMSHAFERNDRYAVIRNYRDQNLSDGFEHALQFSFSADRFPGAQNQGPPSLQIDVLSRLQLCCCEHSRSIAAV